MAWVSHMALKQGDIFMPKNAAMSLMCDYVIVGVECRQLSKRTSKDFY